MDIYKWTQRMKTRLDNQL